MHRGKVITMEFEWYWPAKQMGFVKDISEQYNDGVRHLQVSSKVGDVFMMLTFSLIPLCFIIGFLIRWILGRKRKNDLAKKFIWGIGGVMFVYAILLAVGIGPYIEFYPKGSGFLDLSVIEHIIEGIYCGFLVLILLLGGKIGSKLGARSLAR